MQLFYHTDLENNSSEFTFPADESRHITKVLRKSLDDVLQITNGRGGLFGARIIVADHKRCTAKIISEHTDPPSSYRSHLVVAPTKLNDRFEWLLEKATEIGVHEITPILCERSERKTIKMERMEKVILSAMKQSLHTYLPKLNRAISFMDYMDLPKEGDLFIAHCGDDHKKELYHSLRPKQNTAILIGPEGDFSKAEIESALTHGFKPVALGETRLRTETAAIVACTAIAMVNLPK